MTETPARTPAVSPGRVLRFTAVMYKPQYLLYGILWELALEGTAARLSGEDQWRPGLDTVARIATVVIVLLYLRMVDEQKDLDYDRVHNPDRPLVTGAVTALDLRVAMGIISIVALTISATLSLRSVLAIAAVLMYGVGLWGLEALWTRLRESVLLNLAVTYPVQILITVYVIVSSIDTGQVHGTWSVAWLVVVFAGAFLQFEVARKISRRQRPGEMYYTNALPVQAAVALSLGAAVVAVVIAIVVIAPWHRPGFALLVGWLPAALLLLPIGGAIDFVRRRSRGYPVVPAALFVLILYVVLIAAALLP